MPTLKRYTSKDAPYLSLGGIIKFHPARRGARMVGEFETADPREQDLVESSASFGTMEVEVLGEVAAPPAGPKAPEDLTVREITALLHEHNVEIPKRANKGELLALLVANLPPSPAPPAE
jgi:hypothetical protein